MTIILTTHYIDEAEEMADRIGIISKGQLILVEEKAKLMQKLGKRQLTLNLQEPMTTIPAGLAAWPLALKAQGYELEYSFDAGAGAADIPALLRRLGELGIGFKDLNTRQSSLEEIFVSLVSERTRSPAYEPPGFSTVTASGPSTGSRWPGSCARCVQSVVTPVITTSLYFVVFGSAIGSRMSEVDGVPYGAFIVPGLMMLSLFTESISNASFGIYFPEVHRHHLRAPVGAHLLRRDDHRLRRGGRDQVDPARPHHPHHRVVFRAGGDRAPAGDGDLPAADRRHLQPVRLRDRHLGQGVRAAAASSRCW